MSRVIKTVREWGPYWALAVSPIVFVFAMAMLLGKYENYSCRVGTRAALQEGTAGQIGAVVQQQEAVAHTLRLLFVSQKEKKKPTPVRRSP